MAAPRTLNVDGVFGLLTNVAWTSLGPVALDRLSEVQVAARGKGAHVTVLGVDMRRRRYAALPRMNFSSPYVDLPHRLTVRENATFSALESFSSFGIMSGRRELEQVTETFGTLAVKTPGLEAPILSLSGGNQQKVVLGKWLFTEPRLLILDEPSLGLSPLLVEEMFALIRRLRESGLAILLVEQNVAQSLEIADRAYVMENGMIRFEGTSVQLLASDELRQSYLGV